MPLHKEIKMPLNLIYDGEKFLLVDIRPLYEWVDGAPTRNQTGFRVELVDLSTYDKFSVKLLTMTPHVTPEIFEESRDKIFVRLIDAYAKPYVTDNKRIAYSISAKNIELVKKSATSAAERIHE